MKILSIVGTRPQFLKLAPLSKKFKDENINHIVIHSGQHYDKEMSDEIFSVLKIKNPDYLLKRVGNTNIESLTNMMVEIEKICLKENPNKIIVFGDCDTTTAGALVSKKLKIYLIHIEAGMRSYNKDMPEEINRLITDHMSDLLLCSTKDSIDKLKKENITKNIHYVGNLQLELLKNVCQSYNEENVLTINNLKKNNFVLMTIHREYNTNEDMLTNLFTELNKLNIDIIFPLHPRTKNIIQENQIIIPNKIKIIKPINYLDMTILERYCKYIITDSGGIQPEAWFLEKKCIIMRSETEWIEPLITNNNILYDYKTPLHKFIINFLKINIDKTKIDCCVSNKIVDKITKKNIYYLLENRPSIKPISGSQITELSIIKSLSHHYNVYYNNQLVDFSKPNYGLTKSKVELPDKKYDYYWIRNNDNIFKNCKGTKILCAAPYNGENYKNADIVVCYTETWKKKLEKTSKKYNNSNDIIPKKVLVAFQSISKCFFNKIDFNKVDKYRNIFLKSKKNCDLLIGHFGRISPSCYPKYLLPAFDKLCIKYPNKNLKLIFCGNNSHQKKKIITNNKNVLTHNGIPHNKIYKYIQLCHLTTSDYDISSVNWGGCMHIIESIACGVPILCGNFDVRKEQLGEDYPLFWDIDSTEKVKVIQIFNILENILLNKINLKKIKENMKLKTEKYKSKNVGKYIFNQLENN